jgi:hypothetical protein
VFIRPINAAVSFNVFRPQANNSSEDAAAPTLLATRSGTPKAQESSETVSGALADGRTRVVWNIDVAQVQDWFENQKPGDSQAAALTLSGALPDGFIQRDDDENGNSPNSVGNLDHLALAVAPEATAYPAYADGEAVEYFSSTNKQWAAAVVDVQHYPGQGCVLNVKVAHGAQLRVDVPLQSLRSVLQPGELVEVVGGSQKW